LKIRRNSKKEGETTNNGTEHLTRSGSILPAFHFQITHTYLSNCVFLTHPPKIGTKFMNMQKTVHPKLFIAPTNQPMSYTPPQMGPISPSV
jgi:hypothetical protein